MQLPLLNRVILGVAAGLLISYGLIFGISKQVAFSYSNQDCVRQLTILPGIMKQAGESGYEVRFSEVVTAGSVPLVSFKTCFKSMNPPQPGTSSVAVSPFGSWFMAKRFSINVGEPPTATTADFVDKTLPVTRPVEISLTQPDDIFDYRLKIGDEEAICVHEAASLSCDIEPLGLAQGQDYEATLLRYFNDKLVEEIGGGKITTLKALVLAGATVSEGQTIYDKPTSLRFEYDKTIATVKAELKQKNGETLEAVPIKTSSEGKTAIITPDAELKRNSQFVLTLKQVEADDGSALPVEQIINFTVSGGPKVTSINIGQTGVATGGTIVLTFDQEVANVDKLPELVTLKGITGSVTKSGDRLIINYNAGLCVDFAITVKKGLESVHGVAQTDDWSYAARTICYSIHTIGYSKQGRAINAFVFGSGKTILYTGAIHGNEQSTRLLMNTWINELDANARSIPAGTRIVVIPSVNPDGVAANTRANANNVDLNRNFNVSDWKKDIVTPSNQPWPGGGGSAPNSEPETQALSAYTSALQPHLTMSYHSVGSYAIGNGCGSSGSLAATYAKMTGYANMTGVGGAFGYEITGTYDDWICEKLGRQSVLIELASSSFSEFSRNRAALWAMARS